MSHQAGHIKRDPASGAVAIRTNFDEANPQLAPMAWLVGTIGMGSRHAPTTEVDGWDDLYTPVVE